jgi:hypothetical protein
MAKAKKISSDEPRFCDVTVSVLGYKEDNEWVALGLEMDLRGYGKTFDEALEDLIDLVQMQISFATFKGQPEMIFHPAASEYYNLFAQLRADRLRFLTQREEEGEPEYHVGDIPIPPAHVIAEQKKNYSPADA